MKQIYLLITLLSFSSLTFSQTTVNLNPVKDNSIYSDNPSNASGIGNLFSGTTCTNANRRALMQFDLSAIPTTATVTAVSLTVNINNTSIGAGNEVYNIYPLSSNFGEGVSNGGGSGAAALAPDATWSHAMFNTTAWTTAGGDFNPTTLSAVIMPNTTGNQTFTSSPNFISEIQSWVENPALNFGLIMIGQEGTTCSARRFGSKDTGTVPILTVTYTGTLGVSETVINPQLSFYPNPSTGIVNFDLNKSSDISVEIFNLQGQLTQKESYLNTDNFKLNILGDAGIYLVKLHVNGTVFYRKMVKK